MNRILLTFVMSVLSFVLAGSAFGNTQPEVLNVSAAQRAHTAFIDLTYDIIDADGDAVHVSLWYSTDGGVSWDQECVTVSGDVGAGIFPATGLTATWDAGVDFPDYINTEFSIRVYADDGSGVPAGFVLIPPESVSMPSIFTMGSIVEVDETPHQVTLTGRFQMASTEVTNAQYMAALQWAYDQGHVTTTTFSVHDALDGSTEELLDLYSSYCLIRFSDGVFSTSFPARPVVGVSWYGSASYCDWLSLQEGLPRAYDHGTWSCNNGNPYTATGYRLPTEAEWEFACRSGTMTHFNTGDCLDAGTEANYNGNYPYSVCPSGPYLGRPADVGSYPANQWGLLDIHGNVYEWCNDWYGTYSGDVTDPEGAGSGSSRVLRGGSWDAYANYCRSANRICYGPYSTHYNYGFRPVRSTQ